MPLNSEISYLQELINDFPPQKEIIANEAFNLLAVRYEELEKNTWLFIKTLDSPPKAIYKFPLNRQIILGEYFPVVFYSLILIFHEFLFKNILSNAGKFRNSNDPESGRVGFGGVNPRMHSSTRFTGIAASEINNALKEKLKLLKRNSNSPIESGLEFYRSFVKIHPFYDANGRIGRLVINIYLQYFGYVINWKQLEIQANKNKFIKKLNECHKREGQPNYNRYFGYLLKFFNKFIIEVKNLEGS